MPRTLPFGCCALAAVLSGCASFGPAAPGVVRDPLPGCGAAPRCVSSTAADAGRRVEPLLLADPATGWAAAVAAVRGAERTAVVTEGDRYLHAEVMSPWRFYVDDLELLRGEGGRVDVRSSSRVGYYDFGVNRKRVEALRRRLVAAGVAVR